MRLLHNAALAAAVLTAGSFSIAPAQAQLLTLQSGDNVTVGSAGTSGTYLGAPISNGTSSYTVATGNTYIITTDPNSEFTLNSGGSLTGNSGGDVGIDATNSTINVNGGSISANFTALGANGGTVNISGGSMVSGGYYGLFTNSASVNISGGTLSGFISGYEADSGGTANITGGTFSGFVGNAVSLSSASFATISGGSFSQGGFGVGTGSTINLLGTFSQTTPITGGSGTITGTLLDGETLNASYGVSPGGLIEFNSVPAAVPEASSVVSLGLLMALGLGGLAVSAKRRKASAAI